ncbi:MAG: Spy/CpxP family protein refolding chaperone [Prochlorotrichaceae cyanobacterium]
MQFIKPLQTLAISAVGIGLVSLALAAHPGQAELNATNEAATLLAQVPEDPNFAPPEGAPDGEREENSPPWLGELNLSTEQMQRIKAIHEQYKPQFQANRESMRSAHDEFRQLMAGNAPVNQLRQKHQQLQTMQQQSGDLRFESMLAIREVLTPEQRQQAATLMEERHDRRTERGQDRRERRGERLRGN